MLYPKAGVNKPHGPASTLAGRKNPAGNAYAAAVLADSPTLYWKLDEASGTAAVDLSGNGIDGTYTGGFTLNQAGPGGNLPTAVDLDGTDGKVASASDQFVDATSRTFEGWAVRTATVVPEALFGSTGSTSVGLRYDSSAPTLHFNINSTTTNSWISATPAAGTWFHWALTVTQGGGADNVELFVNGVSKGTKTNPDSWAAGNFQVGARSTSTWPFDGKMAHAAVYGAELSEARIQAHFAARGF